MTPRYAQLLYTSFDPPGGGQGGWQVKQTTGGLSEVEHALVMEHVTASFSPITPLPRFPSSEEVDARPRCLLVLPGPHGQQLLVYSCPAGRDGSGRPGNVFNHVLLDRDPLAPGPDGRVVRPVERFASPDWLSPFGPEQVVEAVLTNDPPAPVPQHSREAVAGELAALGLEQRDGLGALLDAVADALRLGPPVLLVADDEHVGAWWVAAVAFLAAPATSLRLSFATFDRLADVRLRGTRALVTVVPRADVDAAVLEERGHWWLLDPEHQPEPDDRGWPSLDGRPVPFDDWSELALAALSSPVEPAAGLLARVDDVGRRAQLAAEAPPAWALGVIVAGRPDLSEVWPAAARTVSDPAAGAAVLDDVQHGQVQQLVTTVGGWPGHGWELVQHLHAVGAGHALRAPTYDAYVLAVLTDDTLLCGAEPAPLPADPPRPGAGASTAADSFGPVLRELGARDDDLAAMRFLRALDLVERAGVRLAGLELGHSAASAVAALLGPSGPALITAAGPVGPAVVGVLRPGLTAALGVRLEAPGSRLDPQVAGWLWPSLQPQVLSCARTPVVPQDPLLLELVVWVCGREAHIAPALRTVAARALLAADATRRSPLSPADRATAAVAAVGGWNLGCDDLLNLVRTVGTDPEVDLTGEVCRVLLDSPPGPDTWELASQAHAVAHGRGGVLDDFSGAVLDLYRWLEPGWSSGGVADHDGQQGWRRSVDVLLAGLRVWTERERVFDESRDLLAPSLVVAAVRTAVWSGTGLQMAYDPERTDRLVPFEAEVPELLERGAEAAVRQLRWPKGPLHRFPQELFSVAVRLRTGRGQEAVLGRAVLGAPLRSPWPGGPTLAEVLLRAHLNDPGRSGSTTPEQWVEWQLTELERNRTLTADGLSAVTAWARNLTHPLPAATRSPVEA